VEWRQFAREPAAELRPYVERLLGYEASVAQRTRLLEPPGPGTVLIIGLGSPLGLVDRASPASSPAALGSFVAGPDDARTELDYDGGAHGVEVNLTPLATRMLFQVPMNELARRTVRLEDLLGAEAGRLEARLSEAPSWRERLDLVEEALRARLAAAEPPPPDVAWAWRRLSAARGRLRAGELVRELGCSRKHLAARFREHVGLPPRLIGRLFRFQHALERLSAPEGTIAELAYACGYYDQAHLDRDFRDFLGTTPSGFAAAAREQVTSVQATPPVAS
jgi:AraC-like DNA-binding protein